MTESQLRDLLYKFDQGTCTPEEEQLLMQWAKEQESTDIYWTAKQRSKFYTEQARAVSHGTGIKLRRTSINRIPWIAAASVLLLIVAGYFVFNYSTTAQQQPVTAQQIIMPGNNRATLTLSDGSIITLDDKNQGVVASEGPSEIIKSEDGKIAYQLRNTAIQKLVMNTMTTPRGGQYQLTLPDGTDVWLNAESSISFPAAFTENTRTVIISGEAYLDIKKDKSKPFIVNTKKQKIEVLGTAFNINNYDDENTAKTTLVEGAIKINTAVLKPGEQMQTNNNTGATAIKPVDTDLVISWKNGQFNFSGASIETIMRQLSRWYDVAVEYKGKVPERRFGGKISRDLNLEEVISILNFNDIKAKLNGRKIIIEP
jgi:transmembrane sensor